MLIIDTLLIWWLRLGRYPWSRLYRVFLEQRYRKFSLPPAGSVAEVAAVLSDVTWTMDSPLHLYDAISWPETVWHKRRDDCDGFAVLAATLLKRLDPATNPMLLTVMLQPVKESHTVCVFREGGHLRFFDNHHLNQNNYQDYEEVAKAVGQRGQRIICWDVVDPERLRIQEFHRGYR